MSTALQKAADLVRDDLRNTITSWSDTGIAVVKAPPGAGKTYLLLHLLSHLQKKARIAVACFTNAQADDICARANKFGTPIPAIRFLSSSSKTPYAGGPVARSGKDLPLGKCVVVANTAKWALSKVEPFDYLFVDEAWQISWADLVLLRGLAAKLVLIGDPGQIPPVVSIETDRWETSPAAPHRPAPDLFLSPSSGATPFQLPGSRRLPSDTVAAIQGFYDFEFGAFADDGERYLRVDVDRSPIGKALGRLADQSITAITLPTPDEGPPRDVDRALASHIATIVKQVLDGRAVYSDSPETRRKGKLLTPADIGIVASHRSMNTAIQTSLPSRVRNVIKVDTPERWQGLERKLMIAVHPLSGTTNPSSFDLETGRLCVMASRHQSGLIVVSRDHVNDTLTTHLPVAAQALGRPDTAGAGHDRHLGFWGAIRP